MYNYIKISLVAITITVTMSGCVSRVTVAKKDQKIQKLTQELAVAKSQVTQLKKVDLTDANTKIQKLKEKNGRLIESNTKRLEMAVKEKNAVSKRLEMALKEKSAVSNSLIPQNAKPGECYAKVLVPAKYEKRPVKRLVKEAKTTLIITPATYKIVKKRVKIRDASVKLKVIPATYRTISKSSVMVKPKTTHLIVTPATYKTVSKRIMVEQEQKRIITIPATYKTLKEKILVSPAHRAWKRGHGEIEKVNDSTSEIMCLVNVPAVYKRVNKKVLDVDTHTKEIVTPAVYKTVFTRVVDTPARTKKVIIPAVYKTIREQVIDTPARTVKIKIPAIYKIVLTKVVNSPAKKVKRTIPAVYKTYYKTVKTSDSYSRWQQILCKTNTNTQIIYQLQRVLQERGYKITKIDGIYGPETQEAVKEYQKENNLSQGALTLKTLKSLGLK